MEVLKREWPTGRPLGWGKSGLSLSTWRRQPGWLCRVFQRDPVTAPFRVFAVHGRAAVVSARSGQCAQRPARVCGDPWCLNQKYSNIFFLFLSCFFFEFRLMLSDFSCLLLLLMALFPLLRSWSQGLTCEFLRFPSFRFSVYLHDGFINKSFLPFPHHANLLNQHRIHWAHMAPYWQKAGC